MEDIGILLRGKSLEKASLICDKFDDCYLINDFNKELELIGRHVKGKNITHFVNSSPRSRLVGDGYMKYNVDKVGLSFTESMYKKGRVDLVTFYKSLGVKEINYISEEYRSVVEPMRNSGVICIFHVSEVIKPRRIWMAGLDFYHEDYLVKENTPYHLQKSEEADMIGSFVKIVESHPDIEYNLITYYRGLPKIDNLTILGV